MATMTELTSTSAIDSPHEGRPVAANMEHQRGATDHANGSENGNSSGNGHETPRRTARDLKYRHVFATHSLTRTSPLTQHERESPTNFVGFRNLMILVLLVSNLRLMIVNFKKYGVLICLSCHDYRRSDVITGLALYLLVPAHLFVTYLIEYVAAQQAKKAYGRISKNKDNDTPADYAAALKSFNASWYTVAFFHSVNAVANLYIATKMVYSNIHHPGIGTLCEFHAVIVFLKCMSYALTNRDLRHAYLHPRQADPLPELYKTCSYPQNINIGNLCYFWWAPTLVYQPVYPRTNRIRWTFVFKRLLEVAGLSIVIWIASAQYAAPLLQNSVNKILELNLTSIMERIMKLSTISVFCWLCGFFALFQSSLNALAEIMTFGDREFYGDWWNVSNIRSYWTTWNKPVTNFMRRHIYSPLVGRGWPPAIAQILVFLFSGILHELLVGVPTHNIIGVAFIGMMVQIPLIAITDYVQRWRWASGQVMGNMIFWMSFCLVGQPLAALCYFFAWQAKYGSVSKQFEQSELKMLFTR